jgi:hypothetical protein
MTLVTKLEDYGVQARGPDVREGVRTETCGDGASSHDFLDELRADAIPAPKADASTVLVREQLPAIDLLFVDPAGTMERLWRRGPPTSDQSAATLSVEYAASVNLGPRAAIRSLTPSLRNLLLNKAILPRDVPARTYRGISDGVCGGVLRLAVPVPSSLISPQALRRC